MYKRQIYQIAESNRIEKIDSVSRIESNGNFFCPNWNALAAGEFIRTDAHEDTQVHVQLLRSNANDCSYQHKPTHLQFTVTCTNSTQRVSYEVTMYI